MKLAILGLGTIGSGVYELAEKNGIEVAKILEIRFQNEKTTTRIEDICEDPSIDVVAETMGGLHPAYEFATAVLKAGKHFVTANKLLVSAYGRELTALAKESGAAFLFSAACGGGIPYLANLQIQSRVDEIEALGGILNGTTNFILDAMQSENKDYSETLAQAQALGYAERDPSSDVDGLDTMRKLILACAVAYGVYFKPEDIPTAGISNVSSADADYAKARGLVLRLCAFAEKGEGAPSAYVEPVLVPAVSPEASILKNVNYAWYRGAAGGLMSYSGQGAGKLPTATNVLRDVLRADGGEKYMTRPDMADAVPDNAAAKHAYYVRIEKGAAFPEEWIASEEVIGDERFIVTAPVSVGTMHETMKKLGCGFFAGIRKG